MFVFTFTLFVILTISPLTQTASGWDGWKNLGCNYYGNFRAKMMGHLTDWKMTLPPFTAAYDMVLARSGTLFLRTLKRDSGYSNCGMASVDFNSGEVLGTSYNCPTQWSGSIDGGISSTYVYSRVGRGVGNHTTEVFGVNDKLELEWSFEFTREYTDHTPVAVLPLEENLIIVVVAPYSYPESGIGTLYYSRVYAFDATSVINGEENGVVLTPVWKKVLKRGAVMYYNNHLYFKSSDNLLKLDPSSGNVVYEDPIPYPRIYSNMLISETNNIMIYNCGLPTYADMNHNQCAISLDNFTVPLWTHVFPGDHNCYNIALSDDESLFYVQCKFGSWSTSYDISAIDVPSGKIVSSVTFSNLPDSSLGKMSAAIMDDGSVIVPLPSKIVIYDSKLKSVLHTITWDKNYAFYGALAVDDFKCFAYCISAADTLFGKEQVQCFKKCI